jgi:hypothetical protein
LRSARGDSEPFEVPGDDVPFVALSLPLDEPLLEELFVAEVPEAPLFDEFDDVPLEPVLDEFIDEFDDVLSDVLLAVELGLLIEPAALELLPVVLSELVLCASAAPPAIPIAPTATAVSFKIAFIIHLLKGVGWIHEAWTA